MFLYIRRNFAEDNIGVQHKTLLYIFTVFQDKNITIVKAELLGCQDQTRVQYYFSTLGC